MGTDTSLPPPLRWIEGLRTAARAESWREMFAARMRSRRGAATLALLAAGAIYLAGHSLLEARSHSEDADAPRYARDDKLHLSEDPSAATFAPVDLHAHLDWRAGAFGVVLTWEPTYSALRIYRIPVGKSKYIEADGSSGQLFDADVVPGGVHYYVACAYVRGEEYCSDPITYEVPRQIWR